MASSTRLIAGIEETDPNSHVIVNQAIVEIKNNKEIQRQQEVEKKEEQSFDNKNDEKIKHEEIASAEEEQNILLSNFKVSANLTVVNVEEKVSEVKEIIVEESVPTVKTTTTSTTTKKRR